MPRKEEVVWNRFSVIYDRFMKKDEAAYEAVIERIALLLEAEDNVLELAAGTGTIALGLAGCARNIEATDFSPDMVAVAQKKADRLEASNLRFSVQDASDLRYAAGSFDVVIISNALHIMPEPEKALSEIKRVLKPEGILIAPTFIHGGSIKAAILSLLMSLAGFRAYHKWTQAGYHAFLEKNGFEVLDSELIKGSFPLAYVTAKQKQ